jgi:D-glycero-D-manno-heptose 1,7-bisphosphate phosphatase
MSRPAVFIDRDGTLIEDVDFLTSVEQIRFMPLAVPAMRRLRDAGYAIVIVTNQSAVARGLLGERDLQQIHEALVEQVEILGGQIDGVYYCPHLPPETAKEAEGVVERYVKDCSCRKPRPGMFLRARDELDLDFERSFAVGDAWRDVEAALAVGVPSVKLPRPPGRTERARPDLHLLGKADTLGEAAELILTSSPEVAQEQLRNARAAARDSATATGEDEAMVRKSERRSSRSQKKEPAPEPQQAEEEVAEVAKQEKAAVEEVEAEEQELEAGQEEAAELEYDTSLIHSPELDQLEHEIEVAA